MRAEELGLDSVTISDHFQPWRLQGGHAPNSLAWMSWVLARTERVLVGTSVMTPTFRYNPAVVAQTFATMACLAPGRVMLGVGTGEALNEVAVGSVGEGEWPEFKERFGRLREAVRLMRELWTQDRVTFEGEYYRTEDAAIYDRPDQPVPVYVAAGGPDGRPVRRARRRRLHLHLGQGRELYADQLVPAVDEGLDKAGRGHDEIDRMIEIKVSWDPDPDLALENTRFWAPLSLTAEQKHSHPQPRPRWRRPPTSCRSSRSPSAGSWPRAPRRSSRRCASTPTSGSTTSSCTAPATTRSGSCSTFAEQVLPGLRELTPASR